MRKKKHAGKRANDLDSVAVPLQRNTANYSGQVSRCAPTAHYRKIKSLRRRINRCRASIKQIREALWYAYYVTPPIELSIRISKM